MRKWRDNLGFNLLTVEGHLTPEAKELANKYGATSLDELLEIVESLGNGLWYTNDTNRPDVGTKGHYADVLRGKFSTDDGEVKDPNPVNGDVNVSSYETYENMYLKNGRWVRGNERKLKK